MSIAFNLCDIGVYPIHTRNFDDQVYPNFERFVILCKCLDTPSEKEDCSLTITKVVQCLQVLNYSIFSLDNLLYAELFGRSRIFVRVWKEKLNYDGRARLLQVRQVLC